VKQDSKMIFAKTSQFRTKQIYIAVHRKMARIRSREDPNSGYIFRVRSGPRFEFLGKSQIRYEWYGVYRMCV